MNPSRKVVYISAVIVIIILAVAVAALFRPSQGPSQATNVTAIKGVIKIGLSTPLSGGSAYTGDQQRKGAIMAVEEINAQGGIKLKDGYYKVELVVGDDESKPATGVSVFEKFATQDKVNIVIGEVNSDVVLAMMDVSAKYKIPYISLGASSDALTKKFLSNTDKYKYYIRMTPYSEEAYGKASVVFLEDAISKGWFKITSKKVAVIAEKTAYGIDNANAFKRYAKEKGWEIVVDELFPTDQEDFTPILLKVRDSGAEVIWMIGTSPGAAAALTKQFQAMRLKTYFLGVYVVQLPAYINLVGNSSDGLVWALNSLWSDKVPRVKEFMEKFKARWGEASISNAGLTYDTIMMIKKALEKVGEIDPDKFIEAFLNQEYEGSTGYYVWNKTLHCPEWGPDRVPSSFGQIQWEGGSYHHEFLWPIKFFPDAKFKQPWWFPKG
jgi:branched-chain amino acid transport system substrate-binding protein